MKIHVLQHVPFEGLGSIAAWTAEKGFDVRTTRLFAGEPLPGTSEVDWVIALGGPMGVGDVSQYRWLEAERDFLRAAVEADRRVLGICLGAQLLAHALGARVAPGRQREIGWFPIARNPSAESSPLFGEIPDREDVFHWHGDAFDIPDGAQHLASSAACASQAFAIGSRVVGLQFHLETTPKSARLLVDNCGDELVPGPFVQEAASILGDETRFRNINARMRALLERMAEAT